MFRSQARADERQQHFCEARDAFNERRRVAAEGREAEDEHEACGGNMVQSLPREARRGDETDPARPASLGNHLGETNG